MHVEILPAVPLPGGVKVARRPVKPLVLVRVQVWQPIYGRQADISWLRLSRKQDPFNGGRSITDAFRQSSTINRRKCHETRDSLSNPTTLPKELQTNSNHPHSTGSKSGRVISPGSAIRCQTATGNRPVAQKQSTRLICERTRSVTARADQPSPPPQLGRLAFAFRASARRAISLSS